LPKRVDESAKGEAMSSERITTFFVDILPTSGGDRHMRRKAAEACGLNHEEMDEPYRLTLGSCEMGGLTLAEYLKRLSGEAILFPGWFQDLNGR
jgi:hypothetical protein